MSKQTEKSRIEEAQRLLREEHERKLKECSDEIQASLDKYGLTLDAFATVRLVPRQ